MFSKSFPKKPAGGTITVWEEIQLTEKEEKEAEESARKENIRIMKECIADAAAISKEMEVAEKEAVAIALFEKRASHEIYWKEEKAKEKLNPGKPKT